MYTKVAAIVVGTLFISGCVSQNQLEPTKAEIGTEVGTSAPEANSTVIPLDASVQVEERKPSKKTPPHLKPEPFSLESDESDPELLGPQTTLSEPLLRDRDSVTNEEADQNSTN